MVHVEGTRSLACRLPVQTISSTFIDMAMAVGAPIVPVRMVGGLPVAPLERRLEFPLAYGKQDYWLGAPIMPETLAGMAFKSRSDTVLAAINGLGPALAQETPFPGDPAFAEAVSHWRASTGASEEDAVMFQTLAGLRQPGAEVSALLGAARAGKLELGPDARSQWLGRFAARLFGPKGPAITGLV